jgi:16S rRNA (guanine527-N7)-methyltransferase
MNRVGSGARSSDRQAALRLVPVSRETAERFSVYVDLLARWNKLTNLVSEATFGAVWTRHIADCAQLNLVAPTAIRWVDIGSGAGLPGLVLAMQLADVPGALVHCIECDQRKCAFLRQVAHATGSPAIVHAVRVQAIDPVRLGPVQAVTARAVAPFSTTLHLAKAWMERGAIGVFPRGRFSQAQIDSSNFAAGYAFDILPSVVDSDAAILRVPLNPSSEPG